ncbi:MAG: fasciclin domain-containing protein [Gillisia sp.]
MKLRKFLILAAVAGLTFTSCNNNNKKQEDENARNDSIQMANQREAEMRANEAKMQRESNSIASKAMDNQELSTLTNALQSADLATMLKQDEGPYTVFAPTNDAFNKVGQSKLDDLMKDENQDKLKDILQYHVVKDSLTSDMLSQKIKDNNGTYKMNTAGGGEITASMQGNDIVLKDENGKTAKVVKADINASNGVIHEIDAVLMKKQ